MSRFKRVFGVAELMISWEQIANTSGRSDEAQRQLLRQTLAYQTLKHMAASTGKLCLLGIYHKADHPSTTCGLRA